MKVSKKRWASLQQELAQVKRENEALKVSNNLKQADLDKLDDFANMLFDRFKDRIIEIAECAAEDATSNLHIS